MSTRMRPYMGAKKIDSKEGIIYVPDRPNTGKYCRIERYSAYASMGYKSNYERVRKEWIYLHVDGQKDHTFSYTGKNLATASEQWIQLCGSIREAE